MQGARLVVSTLHPVLPHAVGTCDARVEELYDEISEIKSAREESPRGFAFYAAAASLFVVVDHLYVYRLIPLFGAAYFEFDFLPLG